MTQTITLADPDGAYNFDVGGQITISRGPGVPSRTGPRLRRRQRALHRAMRPRRRWVGGAMTITRIDVYAGEITVGRAMP